MEFILLTGRFGMFIFEPGKTADKWHYLVHQRKVVHIAGGMG
jgi:hypothetical protein